MLLLFLMGEASAQTSAGQSFRVFVRGVPAGNEEVTLLEAPDGYTLRGSARFNEPLNLSIEYWEARYDRAWKPLELSVNIVEGTNRWTVHTTVAGTNAYSDITQNGQNQRRNQIVIADTVLLPNLVFGAYEALAARLASSHVGDQLQAFVVPQNVVPVAVTRVSDEAIELPNRKIVVRKWGLRIGGQAGSLDVDVWTEGSRLVRLDIPSQMLSVIRDDVSAVSARLVTLARANDEQASIPANGFSLAATISKPAQPGAKLPAVVLVSGTSASERDEVVAGIPIFAQLANALADAGYLVVRYDDRGMGQSGGRSESANYEDFASDVRAVLAYLAKRKDVDPKRTAIIGYGDGGWVSLVAAAREPKLGALALIATPSISGTELVLEQQRQLFERSGTTAAAQQAAVDQQKKILQAVVTGKDWDAVPPDIRRRVDSPLYRSFLTFDPSQTLAKIRQPLLIVQADLDKEVPVYHGEQLAQLGRSRLRAGSTDFVRLPGLNHLLTPAVSGDVGEYGSLSERNISPAAVLEISSWLKKALGAEPSKPSR
jgi:pimeloyl-ACP methyl ester carboxylesterase